RLLADAGVPFVPALEVATRDELLSAAADLRFPLVLKALGDEHKSDRGGVVLGIPDEQALLVAWDDVQQRLRPPSCSIEEMADLTSAVELLVGVRRDPRFGPIVLVGLGGVFAEILRDVRCALGPVTAAGARELLLSLRGAALLTGARGRPPVDLDAVAEVVARLSTVAGAHPEIAEIECNPVAAVPHGAIALDARIVLRAD
ncbi:MAG: acetate--CoA ligase family protein, partial [Actinomycetota bacterium]|nr:acetate--CoA ligase family protein [Actinomycetota bacterium]